MYVFVSLQTYTFTDLKVYTNYITKVYTRTCVQDSDECTVNVPVVSGTFTTLEGGKKKREGINVGMYICVYIYK